jgi:hypothetical protein
MAISPDERYGHKKCTSLPLRILVNDVNDKLHERGLRVRTREKSSSIRDRDV